MGNEYYSHGVLVAPVALYLVLQRVRNDASLRTGFDRGGNAGLIVLLPALLAYLYFLNERAYYAAALMLIPMLVGLVWTLAGLAIARRLMFPIGYLLLMVPLPFIERSTLPLAMFTGVCSGGLVQLLGLDVSIVGNAVQLPNANLVIGAQCSGINSLIALLSLTALGAYLFEGSGWARIVLVLSAIPLAMAGNILRVASLLFMARTYGVQAAFTFYHDYSGIIFFIVALSLLIPLTRLLRSTQLRSEVL